MRYYFLSSMELPLRSLLPLPCGFLYLLSREIPGEVPMEHVIDAKCHKGSGVGHAGPLPSPRPTSYPCCGNFIRDVRYRPVWDRWHRPHGALRSETRTMCDLRFTLHCIARRVFKIVCLLRLLCQTLRGCQTRVTSIAGGPGWFAARVHARESRVGPNEPVGKCP